MKTPYELEIIPYLGEHLAILTNGTRRIAVGTVTDCGGGAFRAWALGEYPWIGDFATKEAAAMAMVVQTNRAHFVKEQPTEPETAALPIPTTPRHGRTNYFPRTPSSFATTDLTGASAATIEATVTRDFGRFLGGR